VQLLAAWLMVTVRPATVSVPVRAAPVVFAATEKFVDPSPDIEAPLVTVIQLALLTDVHAQLEPVVTAMLALRPVEGAEALVGDTL
jgi:hypothetical protein